MCLKAIYWLTFTAILSTRSFAAENAPQSAEDLLPAYSFLSLRESWLSGVLLLFALGLAIFAMVLARTSRFSAEQVIRLTALLLIVTGTLLLVVTGYRAEQIAPALGLLGTVAGYMLGKSDTRAETTRTEEQIPEGSAASPDRTPRAETTRTEEQIPEGSAASPDRTPNQSSHAKLLVFLTAVLLAYSLPAVAGSPKNAEALFGSQADNHGILTDSEIQILNQTGRRMTFFLGLDGAWNELYLNNGRDVVISIGQLAVVVPTADTQSADLPPVISSEMPSRFRFYPKFFLRVLRGGNRWFFCWSTTESKWAMGPQGDVACQ